MNARVNAPGERVGRCALRGLGAQLRSSAMQPRFGRVAVIVTAWLPCVVHAAPSAVGGGALETAATAQDPTQDGPPPEWQPQDPLVEFVESCKAALSGGGPVGVHTALLSGHGTLYGKPAKTQLLVQPGPRYLLEIDSDLDFTWAVAPSASWELDETGAQWPLEFADAEFVTWIFLVMSGDWLFDPEFAPAITVELGDDDGEGELQHARLKLERGVLDARLSVYRASKLPAKLVLDDGENETTIEFSRWSEGPGHLWPMRTVIGDASGTVIEFERFTPPPSYLVDPFARKAPIEDATFDPKVPEAVECKRAANGQWLVHPRIDGRDVGWFLFQPGAPSWLDARAAKLVEPTTVGRRPIAEGDLRLRDVVRAKALTLGPLTWRAPVFSVADTSGWSEVFGVEIAGSLGSAVLRRAAVTVDFASSTLTLRPSEGFALDGAVWSPLHSIGYAPCALAKVAGGEGLVELGIDPDGQVTFHAPFVRAATLVEAEAFTRAESVGVDGELATFEIGGTKLEKVAAYFSTDESRPFAVRSVAGEFPCELFGSRAKIVFDLPARRLGVLRDPK